MRLKTGSYTLFFYLFTVFGGTGYKGRLRKTTVCTRVDNILFVKRNELNSWKKKLKKKGS